MPDPSLGTWLRRERERRGITLRSIAEQTKVAAPLLAGLEADDVTRWPGGIYRRAFVRSYASAIGLDPDEVVRRFEAEHGTSAESSDAGAVPAPRPAPADTTANPPAQQIARTRSAVASRRTRVIGTVADLAVALVLGLGCAAAGSRLLWPVLLIAGYYALGVLLSGTSPMVALLNSEPVAPQQPRAPSQDSPAVRPPAERRHPGRRSGNRPVRPGRATQRRVQ